MVTTEPWQLLALCRGKWHLFDAQEDSEGNSYYPFLKEARALCFVCPVHETCSEKSEGENTGIWNGQPL